MSHPVDTVDLMRSRPGWNPWRALRERPDLRLVVAPLPPSTGGAAIIDLGHERVVLLEETLDQAERNAALAHELVHDERQLFPQGTPDGVVQHEEAQVRRITCDRLVPPDELRREIARIVAMGECVRAIDVMEIFEVPLDIANQALYLMKTRSTE